MLAQFLNTSGTLAALQPEPKQQLAMPRWPVTGLILSAYTPQKARLHGSKQLFMVKYSCERRHDPAGKL
jgi:hypothetical protein